jgi:uncharacterized protein Veg
MNNIVLPKISFIYAYPLDVNRRNLFNEKGLDNYPSIEEVKETLGDWSKIWDKINHEDRVISALEKTTKRVPARSLECFVFGGGLNPMSTPFLIPVMSRNGKRQSEDFIQTFIHELIHIFITENTSEYWVMVREKYNNEDILTQNHIIVYAILQELYETLFEKLPPDFSRNDLPPGYMKAIELVKEKGYKNIIDEYYKFIK